MSRHARETVARSGYNGVLRLLRMLVVAIVTGLVLASLAVFGLSATNTAKVVPVLSNSMAPVMPVGSIALTLPVAQADVRVGDVIVFTDPLQKNIRVIHRVIHLYGADEAAGLAGWSTSKIFVKTKGDNNPRPDPWIVTISDATIWRETGSVPHIGLPALWITNPGLRLAAFLFAGAGVAIWALYLLWRRPSAEEAAAGSPADAGVPPRRAERALAKQSS